MRQLALPDKRDASVMLAGAAVILTAALLGSLDWLDDPIWVTAVATVLLALAAIATLVIVYRTAMLGVASLEDAERTRHGQMVTDLSRRWDEGLMLESQKLFGEWENEEIVELAEILFDEEQRPPTEEELDNWYTLVSLPSLIETIGVLCSERVITTGLVYKMWGPSIVSYWNGWRATIDVLRKYDDEDAETSYTYFEQLAEKMAELNKENAGAAKAS